MAMLEPLVWEKGLLASGQMAGGLMLLRSSHLICSHMVRISIMGEREPMTDLMAWNADATRMPYRMHCEYLRHLFLDNDLAEGRFTAGGHPLAPSAISFPSLPGRAGPTHVPPPRSRPQRHLRPTTPGA